MCVLAGADMPDNTVAHTLPAAFQDISWIQMFKQYGHNL